MGTSFIGLGDNKLAVRNATLGLMCAIVVKEFEDIPKESGMYSVVQPFRNLVEENAFYTGYSASIDLKQFVRSKAELDEMVKFLDIIISKLRSFGTNLPSDYTASLPYDEFFQKEAWSVSNTTEHFTQLGKIILLPCY